MRGFGERVHAVEREYEGKNGDEKCGMASDKPLPKAGSVAFQRKGDARREANAIVGRLGWAEVVADRSDGPY